MDSTIPLTSFFADGVDRLSDTHYSEHGEDCDICKEADEAECADDAANGTISLTSVIKTKKCGHCFHEVCLHEWLKTQVEIPDNNGTCPKCRGVLITPEQHNQFTLLGQFLVGEGLLDGATGRDVLLQLIDVLREIEDSFTPTRTPAGQSRYETYLARLSNIEGRVEAMDESHVVGDAEFDHFMLAIRELEEWSRVEFEALREQETQEELWAEAPYEPDW